MQEKSGTCRAVFLGLCHERGVDFTGSMKDVTQETVTARLNEQNKGLMDGVDGPQGDLAGIGIDRDRAAILQAKFSGERDTQGHD